MDDLGPCLANEERLFQNATDVVRLLQRGRFDLSSEKQLQAGIQDVFISAGLPFKREYRLTAKEIPDFFVHDAIAIECKVKGAKKMDIYRQLCRYADHPDVKILVLASNVSMGLPPDINQKPVLVASLSQGWM